MQQIKTLYGTEMTADDFKSAAYQQPILYRKTHTEFGDYWDSQSKFGDVSLGFIETDEPQPEDISAQQGDHWQKTPDGRWSRTSNLFACQTWIEAPEGTHFYGFNHELRWVEILPAL